MTDKITQEIMDLLDGFSGQQNTLFIPRPYLTACDNDHVVALFLNQVMYWSKRGDKDGWFAKSHDDWFTELGMTEFQVRRAVKALAVFGLETKVRRSKFYSGKTTVHYRVDRKKVLGTMVSKLSDGKLTNLGSMGSEETSVPYTENMTETTKEKDSFVAKNATGDSNSSVKGKTAPQDAKTNNPPSPPVAPPPSSPKERKPRERDPIFDAVVLHVFEITSAEELKAMNESDNVAPRIGNIVAWLKRDRDYMAYGKAKKTVGYISAPAQPEHIEKFAVWYRKQNPTASMVTDGEKFAEQWRKYASEINGRKQQTPRPMQKPARPNLTDEQKAARLAEMQRQRQGTTE